MNYSNENWTLLGHNPRPQQVKIINEILHAMDQGYKNIILEAGTGSGKSAIATTIANYVNKSYIITMTNQLLQQYLHDFNYMVEEIKGRSNYPCNYEGNCDECEIINSNKKRYNNYLEAMRQYNENPDKYTRPEKPLKLKKCRDCPYTEALKISLANNNVITNYDFLHYAGNYAGILPERDLLILDESHNLEKKVMQLIVKIFNRKTIYKDYQIDIFDGIIENNMTLKSIQQPNYWIGICEKIIKIIQRKKQGYIKLNYPNNENYSEDDTIKEYDHEIKKYSDIVTILKEDNWIIETPTKKQILEDETYFTSNKMEGLKAELKPLTISNYTDSLLHFGKTRLFMTGTLGSKEMFCKWIGIDPTETYYIYEKSPFPVTNRPIIRDYFGKMSGRVNSIPNWQNEEILLKIHDLLADNHYGEKGVIHVSSNEQAWWIRNNILRDRAYFIAYGKHREEKIKEFEEYEKGAVLIGAGIKDGVDFKGDKCRFQIIFKMPFPNLTGAQINIRRRYDNKWYIYQTVMPLMQAYGRGIRDKDDYCITYVLDSDFESLLNNHNDLFNEYFLEAVEGYTPKNNKRVRRVKRIPKMEAK